MIDLFFETDYEKMEADSARIALIFFGVGAAQLVASTVVNYCFGLVGEKMTRHLRSEAFKAMLRQEMGWFDHPDNSARYGGCMPTRRYSIRSLFFVWFNSIRIQGIRPKKNLLVLVSKPMI